MMGIDLVTEAVHRHIEARGATLAIECAQRVVDLGSTPASLLEEVQKICSRYEFFSTLILSRKVPLQVQTELTGGALKMAPAIRGAWGIETVLVATNAMMRWCEHDYATETPNQRNFLRPTESHMDDVVRLLMLCGYHRVIAFNANLEARRGLSAPADFGALLDAYNSRLTHSSGVRLAESDQPFVLGMMAVSNVPVDPVMRVRDVRLDVSQDIRLWNYYPGPMSADDTVGHAAYLEHPFPTDRDLTFRDAWDAWLAINALAAGRLPNWNPGQLYSVKSSRDDAQVEIMYDLCETGLDGSTWSDLRDASYEVIVRRGRARVPPKDKYQRFLDQITFDTTKVDILDPEFIELPYGIYKVGPDAILWDHLRSRSLFKAIARRAMRDPKGGVGQAKGRAFETVVSSSVAQLVSLTQPIERNVQIFAGRRSVLEMDIAIVWHGVLVIIECKAYQKPLQYYKAMRGAVAGRVGDWEATLRKRDQLLQKYAPEVRAKWSDNSISGAICVLCTSEVEYTASLEATFWLVPHSVPRICTNEELCTFLASDAWAIIPKHPAYVALQ